MFAWNDFHLIMNKPYIGREFGITKLNSLIYICGLMEVN